MDLKVVLQSGYQSVAPISVSGENIFLGSNHTLGKDQVARRELRMKRPSTAPTEQSGYTFSYQGL
jgi:hypothetical protein